VVYSASYSLPPSALNPLDPTLPNEYLHGFCTVVSTPLALAIVLICIFSGLQEGSSPPRLSSLLAALVL